MKKEFIVPDLEFCDINDEEVLLGSDNFGNAKNDWLEDSFWE